MGLSSDLISQFVKVTNDKPESFKESTVYGTTVVYGDDIYVKLDGSELLTPVDTTANVVDGERVTVMIKNHTATITGNITSPSARGKDVEMSVNSLNIKIEGVGDSIDSAVYAANSAADKANSASNAANSAANAASNAINAANDAKRYATDYLNLSDAGLELGASPLDKNVLITPTAIDFRQGDDVLASYEAEYIYLGKASRKATIDLADGVARLYNEDDTDQDYSRLVIEADHSISLTTMCGIYNNVYYDDGNLAGGAHFRMESHLPWYEDSTYIRGKVELSTNTRHYYGGMNTTACLQMDAYNLRLYFTDHNDSSKIEFSSDNIKIDTPTSKFEGDIHLKGTTCIYGVMSDGETVEAFCPQSSSGNVTIGHGVYENRYGNTNIYGNNVNLYTNNEVYVRGGDVCLDSGVDIMLSNSNHLYGDNHQLIGFNSNNNTVIGYGGYSAGVGQTNLYGNKLSFSVKTAGVSYKPYFEAGDSITGEWYGSGFISSTSGSVYFTIPLSKPAIGNPSISVSSVDGLTIRQHKLTFTKSGSVVTTPNTATAANITGAYIYGSSSTSSVKPSSYTATLAGEGNYVRIIAKMSGTTNAVNNAPCGIHSSIKITFS